MNPTATFIGVLGLVAGAFLVWLTVRTVNQGKRPGKWFWAFIAYPVLLGPCCWLSSRLDYGANVVSAIYCPVILIASHRRCPPAIQHAVWWWSEFGAAPSWAWTIRNSWQKIEPPLYVE